jgi:phosphoserine phosphatase
VNAAHIGVTTNAGVVTLMGHVESYTQKIAAERAARRVEGVKAVAEEIQVRLPFSIKRAEIAVIGDGGNDVAMFERSGLCIAMGNASAGVQRAADCPAPSGKLVAVCPFFVREVLQAYYPADLSAQKLQTHIDIWNTAKKVEKIVVTV